MATNDIYDAVVVGAGLTGALVAHHLAEASLSVVVLEATEAPGGIANRGASLALLGTPEFYTSLQARLDPDAARRIWALTQRNLALLTATTSKLDQTTTQTGSFRIADGDAEMLQQSATLLKQDLYAVELEEITEPMNIAGLKTNDDLAFDPAALTRALLDHPNITVEYETEVQAIKTTAPPQDDAPLTVWARKRYIWTKNVILANGAHAVRLDQGLANIVSPLAMHAVDFQTEIALPIPWVLENGKVVVQKLDDNTLRMVGWTKDEEDVLTLITDAAEELCPAAPVVARHTWWVAQSQDGLPVVGQSSSTPNVYFVSGLGPWGLSWVFVAADQLVSLLIHNEIPDTLSIERFAEEV